MIRHILTGIFFIFTSISCLPFALAEGYQISLGFFPFARLIKKTAEVDQTAYTGDFYLGYMSASNNTYGVIASLQHEEYKQQGFSNPSDNQQIVRDRNSLGLAFGHKFDSFYIRLSVYALSSWVDKFNTIETTYKKGTGVQFDFGVPININSSFYFAPQISIQSFQYQSSESGGSESTLSPPMTDTVFSPYLVFGFMI